jgi:hypothetical protein
MRERITNLNRWVEQRQEEAMLSYPVSYRDVARFFLWRGGYALAGPMVILLVSPFTAGVAGAASLWAGVLGAILVTFAGAARALDRPRHAAGFSALALCVLAAPVAWIEVATVGVATAFAAGIALFFGVAGVIVALVASDELSRELATAE